MRRVGGVAERPNAPVSKTGVPARVPRVRISPPPPTNQQKYKFMAVKITYFVHGTTTDNEKGVSSGWSDVGLSQLGVRQSIELKSQIKDKKFDVIFCSDLKRAIDSAKLTFEGTTQIIQDQRLRECNYGKYNAQASAIVEPMQEKNINQRFPEGESYEDVKARIADFLEFLKNNYNGRLIAIVGHKAKLALDVLLKNKTWQPGWEYILE